MKSPILKALSVPKRSKTNRYILVATLALFFLISSWNHLAGPSHPQIQHYSFKHRKPPQLSQPDRLKAVKREFLHAWYGYKDHAWMADALTPLTGQRRSQFCGWSATLVDTLDTLWIMDLREEFDEAVQAVTAIDFSLTNACDISLFESTIRYLGGMLAAYDLSGDERLLPKLEQLGDVLLGQFNTTNGMPCHNCKELGQYEMEQSARTEAFLADLGSVYLEFTRLSQVTDQPKYFEVVERLSDVFESTQNSSTVPGLWPSKVDATSINGTSPQFATTGFSYSLGTYSDSAYEYLVKTHLMLGGITNRFAGMWHIAADAIRDNLLFRAYIPEWNTTDVLFSGIATKFSTRDLDLEPKTEHLACFAGGLFAMSGRMFNNPADVEIGKQLTEGCIWAYETTATGIMPESLTLYMCPNATGPQCEWNQTMWDDLHSQSPSCVFGSCSFDSDYPPGYLTSPDTRYQLRPEAIESVFILYRITGDEYYRDAGWRMFQRIIASTRTAYGHASLADVMHTTQKEVYHAGQIVMSDGALQDDEMESFWLAETLKYFWLLFSEPELISLDEFVFNTEAHPLRLLKGVSVSDSGLQI